jgi:hypothetical protein
MRRTLLALALALLPTAARAQGCVGAPVPEGHRAVQLQGAASTYGLEVDGLSVGASLRGHPRRFLGYSAEYARGTVGDNDAPLQSGGALLSLRAPLSPGGLSLCARGGVMASNLDDSPSSTSLDNFTYPVGIVVELPIYVGGARTVVPYVAPQYLFSRTTGQVLGLSYTESGNSFGMEAGLGVRIGRAALTAGGTFSDLPDALLTTAVPREAFFLRVGVLF